MRQTEGTEEEVEEEGGGRQTSNACSCVWVRLEETSPALASTVGVDPLAPLDCEDTEAADGCSEGRVDWMEAGAVLGPGSY